MILGFYYHIPCYIYPDGRIGMPSFQGLFIESLAAEVEQLYCFLHVTQLDNAIDFWITSSNITIVSLGHDAPAYIKTFLPARFFSGEVIKYIGQCDKIIVRGPSPLLHHFRKITTPDKIVYFIIGSYREGLKHVINKWYRRFAIKLLLRYIDFKQGIVLKGSNLLVNSHTIAIKYSKVAKSVGQVYTTTLKDSDFYVRNDTCQGDTIKLLFVGRFDWAKGLKELIEAYLVIYKEVKGLEIHFVGWEDNPDTPVQKEIEIWAVSNDLNKNIYFHGKKAAGPELLDLYRKGDLYVLPSYHEGFPRTIWEAMASSLPVITTTVGTIPYFLTHKQNAYLIPPHDVNALVNSINELISDKSLRQTLILGGLKRVREVTLEVQAKNIIKFIADE